MKRLTFALSLLLLLLCLTGCGKELTEFIFSDWTREIGDSSLRHGYPAILLLVVGIVNVINPRILLALSFKKKDEPADNQILFARVTGAILIVLVLLSQYLFYRKG